VYDGAVGEQELSRLDAQQCLDTMAALLAGEKEPTLPRVCGGSRHL